MKKTRHRKIVEIIEKKDVETQAIQIARRFSSKVCSR